MPLKGYIVDFICFEARLIVEVDGSQHAESAADAVKSRSNPRPAGSTAAVCEALAFASNGRYDRSILDNELISLNIENLMHPSPKSFPSIKKSLIRLNLDIDLLHENYFQWYADSSLTEFERYVLVLEDRRFFSHSGIDIRSILRALYYFLTFRRRGGASTIEMQFVRTVNERTELTLRRKTREMLLAWLSCYHFNKVALLRSYLSIAFFGSGLTGCEDAANDVFGCASKDLHGNSAALLAAMLVYPKPLTPTGQWKKKIEQRAKYALYLLPRLEERFNEIK